MPEFPDKNDIWVFRKGLGKFSHDDLYRLSLPLSANRQTSKKLIQIKYEGEVVGNSVKFSKWRYEVGKDTTLLNLSDIEATGLMIISDDLSTIKALEGVDEKTRKFYEIKKMK